MEDFETALFLSKGNILKAAMAMNLTDDNESNDTSEIANNCAATKLLAKKDK